MKAHKILGIIWFDNSKVTNKYKILERLLE